VVVNWGQVGEGEGKYIFANERLYGENSAAGKHGL